MDERTLAEQIAVAGRAVACPLDERQSLVLARLLLMLGRWGRVHNLTAVRDPAGMVMRHVADSLSVAPFLEGHLVADVGTGAGFPGLPLAVVEPHRRFLLIDASSKRIAFVRHAVATLGLDNVEPLAARVESYRPERGFDTVIGRAFAAPGRFLALAGHLVAPGGLLLLMCGRHPREGLESLGEAWRLERLQPLNVPAELGARHAVCVRRTVETGKV